MLKLSLCDYSDAYILVIGTITITGGGGQMIMQEIKEKERNKGAIFKNSASFTDCLSEIYNTQRFRCCYGDM